jgi:hypothetical protein
MAMNLPMWCRASASHYNSMDLRQTKKNPDGIGSFGRRIKSGSVALGSKFTDILKKNKITVYLYVKGMNIKTPYGRNIFRVDDSMNKRYRTWENFYIDFFHKDLNRQYKKLGRFQVKFTVYKIKKADST